MSDRSLAELVEEVSSRIVLLQPGSGDEVRALLELIDELISRAGAPGDQRILELAHACRHSLLLALQGAGDAANDAIGVASKAVTELQGIVAGSRPAQASKSEAGEQAKDDGESSRFSLPEWVEESTFSDFLTAQKYAAEEIENGILELEKARPETITALRHRIHTSKGESGAVGQGDLERVFHALEDALDSLPEVPTPDQIDQLLILKDWIATTIDGLREKRRPKESVEHMLARVAALFATPKAKSPAARETGRKIERDEATSYLLSEFLHDAGEEFTQADQILMSIEQQGADSEKVNALFRIFHTHKGIASFLGLEDIVELTHATESLLNLVREDRLEIEGECLELSFGAVDWVRDLLGRVRECLDGGWEIERKSELAPFLARIRVLAPADDSPSEEIAASDIEEPNAQRSVALPAPVTPLLLDETEDMPNGESAPANGGKQSNGRETVKVGLAQVDGLVEIIGELMIIESMVVNSPEISNVSSLRFKGHLNQLTKISRDLQRSGMQLRMVPVRSLFQKMSRLVRDLSRRSGKEVRFVISGEATEMDRSMVEQLADPLIHLVRNAMDHGIEPAAARVARGKPAKGTIRLDAHHEGGSIAIEISDDGGGLDREAILAKALQQGLVTEASQLSENEINNLIFMPGFSTAKRVSEISGRGVGLDVVKKNIDAMRGRVVVTSVAGQGSGFKLVLPLTLAIIDGMLIGCGHERYIIPTLSIVESIKPTREMIRTMAGRNEIINIRGEIFPLIRMSDIFEIEGAQIEATEGLVVVIESFGRRVALLVDEVITQQQVVIKAAGQHISMKKFFSGATILADGRVGLILNVHEMCSESDGLLLEKRRVAEPRHEQPGVQSNA